MSARATALAGIAALLVAQGSAAASPPKQQRLDHGRFHRFPVYSPATAPTSFVLLLSDGHGWTRTASQTASRLARSGALVAGVDLAKLTADLEHDAGQCVSPAGDLENLSHFVQAYEHLPTYLRPLLVGLSSGGAFAYAILAQAPKDRFAGALSLGFCPRLELHKALCTKGSQLEFKDDAAGGGPRGVFELVPTKLPVGTWIVVEPGSAESCSRADVGSFVSAVPGAEVIWPATGPAKAWAPEDQAAFDRLVAGSAAKAVPPPPVALGDLPVVEVPAIAGSPMQDRFAIMQSGDGGWAGLDQGVAEALAARGIPVVGLDSLRYYWTARTPEGLAGDMDRIIRFYEAHWRKSRVLLIGYSQGADTLPFALNRLPASTHETVSTVVLLGLSAHALFEFHVANWLSNDDSGPATLPEVGRIAGVPVLCVYGADEDDSPCPKMDPKRVTVVKLAGGHHFDGDYAGLAQRILDLADRAP
jgi:type IV secretory pathway VirJ component